MPITFPPYGYLLPQHSPGTAAPADWTGPEFEVWLERQIQDLSRLLWPVYNPNAGDWTGEAKLRAVELTLADLRLLPQLRQHLTDQPESPARDPYCRPHSRFFEAEDARLQIHPNLRLNYDRTAADDLVTAAPRLFESGWGQKGPNHLVFWFKNNLQRPRPYQAAMILNAADFRHELAATALHPSMISGHCFAALAGLAGIAEGLPSMPQTSVTALQQYAVDIGDRRVMAGVHYPSDNLATWLVFLDMCSHVCREERIKQILWTAVTERSLVYRAIRDALDAGIGDAYRPAWDELHRRAPTALAQPPAAAGSPQR